MKLIVLCIALFAQTFLFAQSKSKKDLAKNKATATKKTKQKVSGKTTKNSIDLKALKLKKVDKTKRNTKADLVRVSNKKNKKQTKEAKGANVKNTRNLKVKMPKEKTVAIVRRVKKTRATTSQIAKMNYLAMRSRRLKPKKEERIPNEDFVKAAPKKVRIVKPKTKSSDDRIKETLNESFSEEKLHFPVDNGEIITGFGVQPCDDATGLKCLNPGITIRGEEGAEVKAAFTGVVSNVIEEDENHFTIFILHNDKFMTTYSGLQNIKFEKGDTVNRTDVLGEITLDNDTNEPIVEFLLTELITKNQKNIDPRKYMEK